VLYEVVKSICKEKGISIKKLEQKAGLSNGSISKWQRTNPNVFTVKAVADVLEITVDELIGKVA